MTTSKNVDGKTIFRVITVIAAVLAFIGGAIAAGPTAQLEIIRSGEIYTLDASASNDNGNIVTYKYDIQNDGAYEQSLSSSTFSTSFTTVPDSAKVTVVDNDGHADSKVADYPVETGNCDVIVGFLDVEPAKIREGEESEFSVNVYNDGDSQDIRATFYLDGQQIETIEKTVERPKEEFATTVSPEESGEVKVVVDSLGAPCGDKKEIERTRNVYVTPIEQKGTLDLTVVGDNDNELEDARVEIRNNFKITDSDGRATFALDSGTYNVEISRNGYETRDVRLRVESGETNNEIIELRRPDADADLDVRTLDEDGDDLEDVRIRVRNGESFTEETNSDGEASFTLSPDEYLVTASKSNYETQTRTVNLEPGENRRITFNMNERDSDEDENGFIDVNVEDESGDPIENAEVRVENGDTDTEDTDRFGNAQFEVEPDTYEVRVSKSGFESEERTITVDEGEFRTLNFELDEDDFNGDDARLDVTVLDDDGDELEDARIRVENGDTETEFTDNDGEARFFLEPDRYDVRVSKSGYEAETDSVRLSDGERESITFRLDRDDDEDARLEVRVEDEDGDELEDARVEVENGDREVEFTDDDGEAVFFLEADRYDIEVSRSGYEDETDSVRLSEGEDEVVTIELERDRDEDDARLDVEVEDEDGDELEDVRVEVENGDRDVDFTNDDGESRFFLEPDSYDVEVSRSGYRTETESIVLREDDRETLRFTLERGDDREDIRIVSTRLSQTNVCRGDTVFVYANIRNDDNSDQRATFGARGAGSTVANSVVIDGRSTEEKRLRINNVQGSGLEEIEIAVTNGDTDEVTTTLNVQNCDQPPVQDRASAVSINVQPQDVQAGQSIRVSGYVDGARGSQSVEISIDGNTVAKVATEPDGFYEAYVTPQNIGVQEVRAESGGRTGTAQVKVRPNVYVASVTAEEKVFESQEFEICADVQSQVDPSVVLFRDGERIASQTDSGEVCFDTMAQDPDEYTYRVMASAWAVTDSKSRQVEVLEQDDEVKNFPDKLAMVRSGDGIVRVTLYNTGDDLRTYDVSVNGIPEDWFATTEKQVELTKGEKKNVYFYVTPEAEGNFAAEISVDRDGSNVYERSISISSGGTLDSGRKSWIERIASLFRNY